MYTLSLEGFGGALMNGFCQVRLFQTEADAEAYRLTCDEPDTLHIKQAYIHETPSLMTEEA